MKKLLVAVMATCVSLFTFADDLTSSLELIDNPATNCWPSFCTGRSCLTLKFYRGLLFNGGGEVENNQGPVDIYSIDPYTRKATFEFMAGTEAISRYLITSDGVLLAPAQDPRESGGAVGLAHIFSRTADGTWGGYKSISGSVGWGSGTKTVKCYTHCWDMAEFDDRIFVASYDFEGSTDKCASFSSYTTIENAQESVTYKTSLWSSTQSFMRRQCQLLRFGDTALFGMGHTVIQPRQINQTSYCKVELWKYDLSTHTFSQTYQAANTLFPDLTASDYTLVGYNKSYIDSDQYARVFIRLWHTTPFKGRNLYVASYDTNSYTSQTDPWEDTISLTSFPRPLMACSATVDSSGNIAASRISFGGDTTNYPWDFCVVGDTVYALTSRYLSSNQQVRHIIWKSTDGLNFSEVLSFDYHQNMYSLEYRDGYFYVGVGTKDTEAMKGYTYDSSEDTAGAIYRIRCPQEPTSVVASVDTDTLAEGATKAFGFKLSAAPSTNLTLKVAVRASQNVTLDKTSLTFTPSNWSTVQTVNATLADDSVRDTSHIYLICGADTDDVERGEFSSKEVTSGMTEITPVENDIPAVIAASTLTPSTTTADYTVSLSSLGQVSGVDVSSATVIATAYSGKTGTELMGAATNTVTAAGTPVSLTVPGLERGQWYNLVVTVVSAPGVSMTCDPQIFRSRVASDESLLVDLTDDLDNRASMTGKANNGPSDGSGMFDGSFTDPGKFTGGYGPYVIYGFKEKTVVNALGIMAVTDESVVSTRMGTSFSFYASDNYNDLTNATPSNLLLSIAETDWDYGEIRRFVVSNETAYSYYKLVMNRAVESQSYMQEAELYDIPSTPTSVSVAAGGDAYEATKTSGSFVISRSLDSSVSSALNVRYTVTGTAVSGQTYEALSGIAQIPARQYSVTIPVVPMYDGTIRSDSTVILTIDSATTYQITTASATVKIVDGGLLGVSVAAGNDADYSKSQNGSFVFSRPSGAPTVYELTVPYTVSGTSVAGTSYTALSGTVTIPAGASSATVSVVPLLADVPEDTTVTVTIPDEGFDVGTGTASITVKGVVISHVSITAGYDVTSKTNGTFIVSRRAGESTDTAIVVNYTISGTGADAIYTPSGTVTIPAGEMSATIEILACNAGGAEKTLTVTLAAGDYFTDTASASVKVAAGAVAESNGWVYDSSAGTISDGDWTFRATVSGTSLTVSTPVDDTDPSQCPTNEVTDLNFAKPVVDKTNLAKTYTIVALNPAFGSHSNTSRASATYVGELTLPGDGLTTIGDSAFRSCSNLSGDLVFPATITTVNRGAFMGTKITSVDFKAATATINGGDGTFANCTSLKWARLASGGSFTCPNGNLFIGCTSLGDADISGVISVTVLKKSYAMFGNCVALTNVTLSSSLWVTNTTTDTANYGTIGCALFVTTANTKLATVRFTGAAPDELDNWIKNDSGFLGCLKGTQSIATIVPDAYKSVKNSHNKCWTDYSASGALNTSDSTWAKSYVKSDVTDLTMRKLLVAPTSVTVPVISSVEVSNITTNSVLVSVVGSDLDDGSVKVSIYDNDGTLVQSKTTLSGWGSVTFTGLAPSTFYKARATATNGESGLSTTYADVSFTTEEWVDPGSAPAITSVVLSNIATNGVTVTVYGSSLNDGEIAVAVTNAQGTAVSLQPLAAFGDSCTITGLTPNTAYAVVVYASNTVGSAAPVTKTFQTLDDQEFYKVPVISSTAVSGISDSGATITVSGSDLSTGTFLVQIYDANGNLVLTSAPVTGWGSVKITGLSASTTYKARVIATNGTSGKSATSEDIEFTTGEPIPGWVYDSTAGTISDGTWTFTASLSGSNITVGNITDDGYPTEISPLDFSKRVVKKDDESTQYTITTLNALFWYYNGGHKYKTGGEYVGEFTLPGEGLVTMGQNGAEIGTSSPMYGDIVIPSTVTKIDRYWFKNSKITSLTFAAGMNADIGSEICTGCSALTSVVFEAGSTCKILEGARPFSGCSALLNADLSGVVSVIGDKNHSALGSCTSLTNVTLNSSLFVTNTTTTGTIGNALFNGNAKLATIHFTGAAPDELDSWISGDSGYLGCFSSSQSITTIVPEEYATVKNSHNKSWADYSASGTLNSTDSTFASTYVASGINLSMRKLIVESAPVKVATISSVTVSGITTNSAVIAVAGSDLDSGSIKVEIYNASGTLVTTSSTMSNWGSVTVTGLEPSTAYKARAIATNGSSGLTTTHADVSFTTAEPVVIVTKPVITSVEVSAITTVGATITVNGTGLDEGQIVIGVTNSVGTEYGPYSIAAFGGSYTITGLDSGAQYYVVAIARNSAGAVLDDTAKFQTLSAYEAWTAEKGLTGDDAAWDAKPTKWGGKLVNAFVYTYGEGLVDNTTTLITISFDTDGNPVVTTPAVIEGHTDFTPAVIGVPTVTDWTTPIVLEATGNNWKLPSGKSANFFRVRITK